MEAKDSCLAICSNDPEINGATFGLGPEAGICYCEKGMGLIEKNKDWVTTHISGKYIFGYA